MKKWKLKRNIKNFCAYVGVLFQLPHFWTIIILIVLAIISLIVSYNLQENYPFSSAVFAYSKKTSGSLCAEIIVIS